MSETKFPPLVLPVGTARYPKLDEPDTRGEYADNKYKTEVVLSAADTAEVKRQLREWATKLVPEAANPGLPIRTDKKDGTVSFIIKSKNKPVLCDSRRQRLPEGTAIGAGSRIRVSGVLARYPKVGPGKGITYMLDAVQVLDLKERSKGVAAFDIVDDGYVGDAEAPQQVSDGVNRFDL